MVAAAAATLPLSEQSAMTVLTLPALCAAATASSTSVFAFSARPSLRQIMYTFPPLRARNDVISLPMPLLAPVTTYTRPARSIAWVVVGASVSGGAGAGVGARVGARVGLRAPGGIPYDTHLQRVRLRVPRAVREPARLRRVAAPVQIEPGGAHVLVRDVDEDCGFGVGVLGVGFGFGSKLAHAGSCWLMLGLALQLLGSGAYCVVAMVWPMIPATRAAQSRRPRRNNRA
mmetsp:Transcript_41763/g.130804  ORF Transcript_41763/g.130804 Transcript_41763/m.130804 type:complete len:230 (+) Transcript_41763:503-1192(+)